MIDVCSQEPKGMLSVNEALTRIRAAIQPIHDLENVALKSAIGRILPIAVTSPINIPYDRNAAMDGYAFNSAGIDHSQAFTLNNIGTSWAGHPYLGELTPGQCLRIFTGAVVPEQADSVVMQEQVQVEGENIHFPAHTPIKQNIRAIAEDIKQGSCLIQPPKKLMAADLGLLASAGINEVSITRKLKIACFSTGDELVSLGQALTTGKIYDSNRYSLTALLSDPCYHVTDYGVLNDNRQHIADTLTDAAKNHDVIITTGGASVGEADYISEILSSCGQVNFWKVAMKPGKPFAFGKIGQCYFFGLPGNPIAVITTFQQLVTPALGQLCGAPNSKPLRFKATLTNKIKKSPGREEFQRGILSQDENHDYFVSTLTKQGSHMLGSMAQANCYVILSKLCGGLESGETVVVEPFDVRIR